MASLAISTANVFEPAGYRDVEPADYEFAGYGSDGEASQSKHLHPTCLSDVLEEDERSRTTAEWYKPLEDIEDVFLSSSAFENVLLAGERRCYENELTEGIISYPPCLLFSTEIAHRVQHTVC